MTKEKKDQELVKYGVACNCAKGEKPADQELEKTAEGILKCPCCGKEYRQPAVPDTNK